MATARQIDIIKTKNSRIDSLLDIATLIMD
jgi:hypothetical protein